MAKSQLKQNQSYLIKLKIVKVVTNLEIIQPHLRNYSTTNSNRPTLFSFWQKKIKKRKIGNPFPFKRENDVQRTNRFLIVTMWWYPNTAWGLFTCIFHYQRKSIAAPHYTHPNLSQIWHILIGFLCFEKMKCRIYWRQECTWDMDPRMGSLSWL